jgi:hypothetical protein
MGKRWYKGLAGRPPKMSQDKPWFPRFYQANYLQPCDGSPDVRRCLQCKVESRSYNLREMEHCLEMGMMGSNLWKTKSWVEFH